MRWLIGTVAVLAVITGGALAYAPYLPQLVSEGVPPLVGPGAGHFADLAGADMARDLHITTDADSRPLVPELAMAGRALQGPFTYFMGQGGQTLYLMPDKGLVVYRAGEDIQLLHSTLYGAWNSLG